MAPVMKGSFGSSYGHLIGASNLFLVYTAQDAIEIVKKNISKIKPQNRGYFNSYN